MQKTYSHEKIRNYKLAIIILILTSVSLSLFSFYLYDITIKQSQAIESQAKDIQEKTATIEKGIATIKENQASIGRLEIKVNELNSTIKSKDLTIETLRTQLGVTLSELEGLKPITRSYFAAAVSGTGKGAMIPLELKITNGTGSVSVNIKDVELLSGVQDSIRIATNIADQYTAIDLTKRDITISFINDFGGIVTVDGPSAGAAITATMISAFIGKEMNDKVLMTGTIEENGAVGKVGGITEKALAAREKGATKFLVPLGQKVSVAGIDVIEVRDITDALNQVLK